MSQEFSNILNLSIFHEYYSKGASADFSCKPTPQCKKKLAGYSFYFKKKSNGFSLIDQNANNDTEIPKGLEFTFEINPKNWNIFNFTDIEKPRGEIVLFQNKSTGSEFMEKSIKLRPFLFNYTFLRSRIRTAILKIENANGDAIIERRISKVNNEFTTQIDFKGYPAGVYLFTSSYTNYRTIKKEEIYIDPELYARQPFGMIILKKGYSKWENSHYQIDFLAKRIVWRYRINLSKNINGGNYKIEKKDGSIQNNRYADWPFEFAPISPDNAEQKMLIFESKKMGEKNIFLPDKIPILDDSLTLQLVKYEAPLLEGDDPKKKIIIKQLPKPPINRINQEINIYS